MAGKFAAAAAAVSAPSITTIGLSGSARLSESAVAIAAMVSTNQTPPMLASPTIVVDAITASVNTRAAIATRRTSVIRGGR